MHADERTRLTHQEPRHHKQDSPAPAVKTRIGLPLQSVRAAMFGWVSIQSARADEEAARRRGRQRPEESEVSDGDGFGGVDAGGEGGEEAVAETREAQETQLLELYSEAVQAQQEGRHELAKHRYRQILDAPLLRHHLQQHRSSSTGRPVSAGSAKGGALAGDELLEKMRYLATKNMGEVLHLEGRRQEAAETLATATEVDGSDVAVWLQLGALCEGQRQPRAARYAYERGLACQPHNWECWDGLIRALERLGDLSACELALERALRLDPTHPVMRERRRRVRRALADPAQLLSMTAAAAAAEEQSMEADDDAEAMEVADGGVGTTPLTVIPVRFDPEGKQHAWAELGQALLEAKGPGLSRPVRLELLPGQQDHHHHGLLHGGAGDGEVPLPPPRRGGMTERVTEADRLRALGRAAGAEEGGEPALLRRGDGDEDDGASQSQASSQQGRRSSNRQHLRSRVAREASQRAERTAEHGVNEWLDRHLLSTSGAGEEQLPPLPLSSSLSLSMTAASAAGADAGWWEGDGDLGAEETGRRMFEAVEDDEGAELVQQFFAKFDGTHNSFCDVCGVGGELLICETCSLCFHPPCLLRVPGLSQALYCDRCREEAYARAGKRPPRAADDALVSSQVEEITNEFLPATSGNLGALDVMHRLVLRLARVREARLWEDGGLRRVCLALARASRPFARDVEAHTCRDPALAELDFGPEGELFLAELHLQELLAPGAGGAVEQGEHEVACDVFVACVLEALGVAKRQRGKDNGGYDLEQHPQQQPHGAFSSDFLCRFAWLCTLLEARRRHVERALAFLGECRKLLAAQPGQRLELPHCPKHPTLGLDVLDAKKKELAQRDEGKDTRRLVDAFRRGALAAGGTPTPEASRALLGRIRRRFLPPPPGSLQERERQQQLQQRQQEQRRPPATQADDLAARTEELLMDFLDHEVQHLLELANASAAAAASGTRLSAAAAAAAADRSGEGKKPPPLFCADMPAAPDKALGRHGSMLMVALCAAARLGDPRPALRLLHQALHYLLQTDRWGDRLVALYLRAVRGAPALVPDKADRLKVALLEALAQLLACVLGPAWPRPSEGQAAPIQLPHDLGVRIPITLAALIRHSSLPYSSAMLDAAVAIRRAMASSTSGGGGGKRGAEDEGRQTPAQRDMARAAEQAVLRSLGGVVCDKQLEPEFLLKYTITADARQYCRRVLGHLADLLESPRLDLAAALTGPQLKALAAALVGLSRMVWANAAVFEVVVFPAFMALTALILKHPHVSGEERLAWMLLAHEALGQTGRCAREDGRFLQAVLRTSTAATAGASAVVERRAHEATVQCLRCLYDVELAPGCADHRAGGHKPRGLEEALALATFVLRYLDEGEDTQGRGKQMLAALQLVYQVEPAFARPVLCSARSPALEALLLRGKGDGDRDGEPGAEGQAKALAARLLQAQGAMEEGEGAGVWQAVGSGLGEDGEGKRGPLLYAYRRLYMYLAQLTLAPRFLQRKGQGSAEAYAEYEAANLELLHVYLHDLKFNPGSYTSWLGLAERAWQLFLVYLDHAPAFTAQEPAVATAFDRHLRRTDDDAGSNPPSLAPFLVPFFLPPPDVPAVAPGARVCQILRGMGLEGELLVPLGDSAEAQAAALEEGGAWAAVVCAAYRVLTERAVRLLGPVLQGYVGLPGSSAREDKELVQKQAEARFRLATLSYLRRYDFPRDGGDGELQHRLLRQALAHAEAAQELEQGAGGGGRHRRWDLPFLLGKLKEKLGFARHPNPPQQPPTTGQQQPQPERRSHAAIEAQEPGWVASFLQLYALALERSDGKTARRDALYRLHASRLRVLLSSSSSSDAGEGGHADAELLRALGRHRFNKKEADAAAGDEGEGEGEADPARLRWRLLLDCLEGLGACRQLDAFDHRSVYARARALEQLPRFLFPTLLLSPKDERRIGHEALVAGIRRHLAGQGTEAALAEAAQQAARDAMHLLFEKKRPQVVAVWLPQEAASIVDVVDKRTRKYEWVRRRYLTYYLDLLRRCKDQERLLELHRNIRTLKDDNELLHWTQTATLEALVEVAAALLQEEEAAGADDGALFEALYETYVDLVEGATAGGKSSSSSSSSSSSRSSDASFRDRRRQLVPRAGALLVGAYRRLQGQERSSLEAALAHGHRAYPEKQGQAKVSKAASRKRGRPSSSAAAATAFAPAREGVSGPSSSAAADERGPGGEGKRQRVVEKEKDGQLEGDLGTGHDEEQEDDDGGSFQPDAEGFLIRVDDIALDGDED